MGQYLEARRVETEARLTHLRERLKPAEDLVRDKACVYLTGSFARGESNEYSDLDLFIVGRVDAGQRALRRLDEICVKADLIEATRALHIPEFSGDGEYLAYYTVDSLIKTLGSPNDDASNTFTARLLLLLESKPLLGGDVYAEVIDQVIAAYWGDYEDHKSDFVPAFLVNDVLRLWRTFCVNYEARTAREPAEKKAKRKLKNYKLKHSRLLTCYSALAYLLAVFSEKRTVAPVDASEMIRLSPTARLEQLKKWSSVAEVSSGVDVLIRSYEEFLNNINASEEHLVGKFMDSESSQSYFRQANDFGDQVYRLLKLLGNETRLHRLLTV